MLTRYRLARVDMSEYPPTPCHDPETDEVLTAMCSDAGIASRGYLDPDEAVRAGDIVTRDDVRRRGIGMHQSTLIGHVVDETYHD